MTLAAEPPTWNIAETAPLLSGLAGVIAGFAFTGVTLVLTRPNHHDETSNVLARHAIGELLLASLVLGLASLEWALVSGETNPLLLRPRAAAVFAGVTLIVGSIQMVAGICYLVIDFDRTCRSPRSTHLPLISLCGFGYLAYATFAAFYITWAANDVVCVGLTGWLRPPAIGPGQAIPFAAAIVVAVTLTPPRANRLERYIPSLQRALCQATHRVSAWHAIGLVAVIAACGFMLTIFLAADDSSLAQPNGWDLSPTVVLYVAALVIVEIAAIAALVLQGQVIQAYSRSVTRDSAYANDTHPCDELSTQRVQ